MYHYPQKIKSFSFTPLYIKNKTIWCAYAVPGNFTSHRSGTISNNSEKNLLSRMEYWMERRMLRTRSIVVLKFLGFNIKILATQVSGLIRLPQAEIYVDPKTLSQGLELLILEYSHLSQLLKLYTREGGKPILNRLSQITFYH